MHLIKFVVHEFTELINGWSCDGDPKVMDMLSNRRHRIYLIAYWALFFNTGPDFHRAPVIGLHNDLVSSCNCCHLFEIESLPEFDSVSRPFKECSLCRYFDQLHVDFSGEYSTLTTQKISHLLRASRVNGFAEPANQTARGPPQFDFHQDNFGLLTTDFSNLNFIFFNINNKSIGIS